MLSKFKILLLVVLLSISMQACLHETDLSGAPTVTYSADIQRILNGNCNFPTCHGGSGGEAGNLSTYQALMSHVKAGNARKSTFYKVVSGRSKEEMPPSGYSPLSDSDIRLIYLWIEQGAKNN